MEINENLFKSDINMKNRSINDYLEKGERILWHEKPKVKSFVASKVLSWTPIAIIWLIFDLFAISMLLSVNSIPFGLLIFLLFFFAIHMTPVWIWIAKMINAKNSIKNTEYYITNRLVITTNYPNEITINQLNIKEISK